MVLKEQTRRLSLAMSDEHEMLVTAVRDFAQREILPVAAEFDESGEFPLDTVRKMGEMGLMGIEMPEEYGGAGMDTLAHVLTMIEIAKVDASHSTILSVNNSLYCNGILWFGTEAQKREWITPVASGEEIGAYSLTEPMSGSDAGNMASRAVLNEAGTHFIINGRKSWVTSAPVADRIVLFTMTAAEEQHRGITAFLIDTSLPGFSLGKTEPKLGIRASATSEIILDNYLCPVSNVLGDVGQGFKIAMTVLGRRANRHCGAGAGHRGSGIRSGAGVCAGAGGVRRADWQLSDDSAEDRRYENADRSRTRTHLSSHHRQRTGIGDGRTLHD